MPQVNWLSLAVYRGLKEERETREGHLKVLIRNDGLGVEIFEEDGWI